MHNMFIGSVAYYSLTSLSLYLMHNCISHSPLEMSDADNIQLASHTMSHV